MEYVPNQLTSRERYKILTSFVLPRPIAWVTTVGPTGVVNAAPFSFFNVFCEDPPLCMFAVNLRPDGRVSGCEAERSSGIPALDSIVCRLIEQRFVYRPALDRNGRPVRSFIVETQSFYGHPSGG